jgi:hypothetical protein
MKHYAAPGAENNLGELDLCSAFGKRIAANSFLYNLTTTDLLPLNQPIDVVVILDSNEKLAAITDAEERILSVKDVDDPKSVREREEAEHDLQKAKKGLGCPGLCRERPS